MIGGDKYNYIKEYFYNWRIQLKNEYEKINTIIDNDENIYKDLIKNPEEEEYISKDKKNKLYIKKYIDILSKFIIFKKDTYKPETYIESCRMISEDNYDVVYPYGFGTWQKQIFANDELVSQFLSNDFDFSILEKNHKENISRYGR